MAKATDQSDGPDGQGGGDASIVTQESPGPRDPIFAAGGLLLNSQGQVALVRRARHQDWSLPKGKRKPGETLIETALREVREETGYEATIEEFAEPLSYDTPDGLKVVLFWRMRRGGKVGDPDPSEISEVAWLDPRHAATTLSYTDLRRLVERQLLGAKREAGRLDRARRWIRRLVCSSKTVRLSAHLLSVPPELEARIRASAESSARSNHEAREWISAHRELYDRAREAEEKADFEQSWRCITAAHRCEIFYCDSVLLESSATALRREAKDKLTGWRGQTVGDLLIDAERWGKLDPSEQRRRLAYAMQIRDEHIANKYHIASMLREQLGALAFMLIVIVIAILSTASQHPLPIVASDVTDLPTLWYAAWFGSLGGCLSGAWSLSRGVAESRIPERMMGWAVTLVRPMLGAGAGIAAYVLVGPGLAALPTAVIAAAFVAGFSERYILSTVESKEKDKPKL